MVYKSSVYQDSSEWVMDFLRELPSSQREQGLAVYLRLIPRAQKLVLDDTTEILIDRDKQDHNNGPSLHRLVGKYSLRARVFSLGGEAYRRIVSKPENPSKATLLGQKVPECPVFQFNGEPESVYYNLLNPVVALARLGYFVEGFAVGDAVDHREGGIFTKGSVEIVDPVLQYSADMQGQSLAFSFQRKNVEEAWTHGDRRVILASLGELERKLEMARKS
ncbi:MAG: hypothetical protein AABX37_00160 [Nanoarchaeota archaeon]